MDYSSPLQKSSNIRQRFENSPGAGRYGDSPDFTPYNYSSPIKKDRPLHFRGKNRRYFSNSDNSFSSGGSSYSTPYQKHRRHRGNFHNSYGSNSASNISQYVDSSMTQDPWEELENQIENDNTSICDRSLDENKEDKKNVTV